MELKKENKCCVVNDASKIKHRSDSPDLSWPSWPGSRQTRRRRRRRCHRGGASQSCEAALSDRSKLGPPSRSTGQSSSTWSGCGCGQRGSARAPRGRPTGRDPLQETVLVACKEKVNFVSDKLGLLIVPKQRELFCLCSSQIYLFNIFLGGLCNWHSN